MIIKEYLPFRFSREGYLPDRMILQFFDGNRDHCKKVLSEKKKTAHYHLSADGIITALSPLSGAANLLGPIFEEGLEHPISDARRGILILVEGKQALTKEQKEPLIRLLKNIQKEILRIYGEPFDFCRKTVICDKNLPLEELLEYGLYQRDDRTVFRVQTGNYRTYRDAEESVVRLQRAGIAAYITEVVC